MNGQIISEEQLISYQRYLTEQEKSIHTVKKYLRDVHAFAAFLSNASAPFSKTQVIAYKEYLKSRYATSSVNSMLTPVNDFLRFAGMAECRVRLIKCQRRIFTEAERELTKSEYIRLLDTAKKRKDERLCLMIKTICATGIRISELCYITVEAAVRGYATIYCKSKQRRVLLPEKICQELQMYAEARQIQTGHIFRTRSGRPVDRSNVCHAMKLLGREAGIPERKIFPHNLRHLFARTFYDTEKDIVRLADILGHSSIDTTRIYTATSEAECIRQVEQLGLAI